MPWIHDEEAGTLQCVSEKHGRDLTIKLPARGGPNQYCHRCWRNCMFSCDEATGSIVHHFNSEKLPTVAKMIGIAPDITGNLSTDEHVRIDSVKAEELAPGLELNYLIAKCIMRLDFSQCPSRHDYYWDGGAMAPVPDFSGEMGAAWQVVERLDELPDNLDQRAMKLIRSARPISANHQHCCIITDHDRHGMPCAERTGYGAAAPHAIAIAALKAVGITEVPDRG